mgnify:FL=1
MYQKLDNAAWEKYINEYSSLEEKTSIKSFCKERNINHSQFFYHRKRIASADKPVVLQAINFKTKEKRLVSSKSNINVEIGNAKITIPVSEATLINSIIKELLEKC